MNGVGCGCVLALPGSAGAYLAVVMAGMLSAGLFLVAVVAIVVRALAAVAVFRALVWAVTLCILAGVLLAALAAAQVDSAGPPGDEYAVTRAARAGQHRWVAQLTNPDWRGAGSHAARRAG
ncbi:MAG: hypothetical protein ACRDMV_17225 [Streptosporangiales bacterium]